MSRRFGADPAPPRLPPTGAALYAAADASSAAAFCFGTRALDPVREGAIALGPVPPAFAAPASLDSAALSHRDPLLAQKPRRDEGGSVRPAPEVELPISATMHGALITLEPSGPYELHCGDERLRHLRGGLARRLAGVEPGRTPAADFGMPEVTFDGIPASAVFIDR